MAYVISDAYVNCDSCTAECPASTTSEGDNQYVIDANTYIGCGTCTATCPAGTISEG